MAPETEFAATYTVAEVVVETEVVSDVTTDLQKALVESQKAEKVVVE
ncbi:MAG TPA: hypothetical protein VGQ76_15645 [Thermoanaerobaculia bacterium]|nr:hypothetical protein [Thermoanaerobaculia bacterium]